MNPKRMFFVMAGILLLLSDLAIASVVIGNSMLQNKSKKLISLKLDNRTFEEQQVSLTQAKKDIEKYSSLELIAKTVVPQEKDQARTVREIINIADVSGIKIASIAFPSSNLGQAQTKPSTPGTTTPTTTPVAPPITQVKPVENIKGVYQLEITVQSDSNNPVPYSKLIEFLNRLEQNRRTAHVTSINVQPSTKNRDLVSFNLIVNVYIKP